MIKKFLFVALGIFCLASCSSGEDDKSSTNLRNIEDNASNNLNQDNNTNQNENENIGSNINIENNQQNNEQNNEQNEDNSNNSLFDAWYNGDEFNNFSSGVKNSDTYVPIQISESDRYLTTIVEYDNYYFHGEPGFYYVGKDADEGKFDFDYSFINFISMEDIHEKLGLQNSVTKIISSSNEYDALKEKNYNSETNCKENAFPSIDFEQSNIAVTLFFDTDLSYGFFKSQVSSISIVNNRIIKQVFSNEYPHIVKVNNYSCGLSIVKLNKNDDYTFQTVYQTDGYMNMFMGAKPIIYFYPEEEMNLSVKYVNESNLLTTYPKYNNGWDIKLNKDGTFTTGESDREYYALYFDEISNYITNFDEGFYVTKENAMSFLEEKMDYIGYTNREVDEFIMYWLPILEKNEKSLVYFEQTDLRNAECPLEFSTNPDCLIRTMIHIKKVDEETSIKEQTLTHYDRSGFAITEWGGVEY